MTTLFVCDDQKAKYNEGKCAKPNEQKRAVFSLGLLMQWTLLETLQVCLA